MSEDSLARRYGFKLGASLLGLPISLAQQWIATRALGPAGYGSFSFLSSFFYEVIVFFDSGTSTGFYAKLCARQHESGIVVFYWWFAAAIGALLMAAVLAAMLLGQASLLWPAEQPLSVVLALASAFGLWLTMIAGKVVDAYGQTAAGEKLRLVGRVVGLALLAGLFFQGVLTLHGYFLTQIAVAGLLLWLWQRVLNSAGLSLVPRVALRPREATRYGKEFWEYSSPLLSYALAGLIAAVADRCLLQRFAGTVEQGYYGLAYQISSFCFLFTSAMIPLLTRSFAQAHEQKDQAQIRVEFARNVRRLYALAAGLGVFMATESDRIAVIIGGDAYIHAGMAIALMCLYPIHQTIGQINGSFFYATGQTRLYRNLGMINISLGLILTVWLLGPVRWGGLALGSHGLSLKMLLGQLVAVNVQLWFICRQLKLSMWSYIRAQVLILLIFGVIALGARIMSQYISSIEILQVVIAAGLYATLAVALAFTAPSLLGFSRGQVSDKIEVLRRTLKVAFGGRDNN